MNINLSDFTVEREAIIGFVVFKNAKEGLGLSLKKIPKS